MNGKRPNANSENVTPICLLSGFPVRDCPSASGQSDFQKSDFAILDPVNGTANDSPQGSQINCTTEFVHKYHIIFTLIFLLFSEHKWEFLLMYVVHLLLQSVQFTELLQFQSPNSAIRMEGYII